MKKEMKKFKDIVAELNREEKDFEADLNENAALYKASMRIAMKVKRALRKAGMKQADLAKEMGVDAAVVSRYLNGKANLELKTIVRLEEILSLRIIDRTVNPDRKIMSDEELKARYLIASSSQFFKEICEGAGMLEYDDIFNREVCYPLSKNTQMYTVVIDGEEIEMTPTMEDNICEYGKAII